MTLTKEDVDQLKNFALEIPTKYGAILLQFINKKEQDVLHQVSSVEQAHKSVSEEK